MKRRIDFTNSHTIKCKRGRKVSYTTNNLIMLDDYDHMICLKNLQIDIIK